jgi:hypothetical protein
MANAITKTKFITPGGWRTIETGWNARFWLSFFGPRGAQIKVRYGGGWPAGFDSQRQTLDDIHGKILQVGGASIAYARVQVYVQQGTNITYTYFAGPYDGLTPPRRPDNSPLEH